MVSCQKIYVGEGDPLGPRLEQHYANKEFWTWAIFFVSTDNSLNKAHVQHLEARLLDMARQAKRATLDNMNAPQKPALSEAETADAESFLADMLSTFPLLGLTVFEKTVVARAAPGTNSRSRQKGYLHEVMRPQMASQSFKVLLQFVTRFPRFITTYPISEKISNHKA